MAEQKTFKGDFPCKVDGKGRIKLPAELLSQLNGYDGHEVKTLTFGVSRKGDCLRMFTDKMWSEHMAGLMRLRGANKNHDMVMRVFGKVLAEVSIDSSGRILIPKRVKEMYGLLSEVVFATYTDNVELKTQALFDEEWANVDFAMLSNILDESLGGVDDVVPKENEKDN